MREIDRDRDSDPRAATRSPLMGLPQLINQLFREYGKDAHHGFLCLTFEGREHTVVPLSPRGAKIVSDFVKTARELGLDAQRTLLWMMERGETEVREMLARNPSGLKVLAVDPRLRKRVHPHTDTGWERKKDRVERPAGEGEVPTTP